MAVIISNGNAVIPCSNPTLSLSPRYHLMLSARVIIVFNHSCYHAIFLTQSFHPVLSHYGTLSIYGIAPCYQPMFSPHVYHPLLLGHSLKNNNNQVTAGATAVTGPELWAVVLRRHLGKFFVKLLLTLHVVRCKKTHITSRRFTKVKMAKRWLPQNVKK
jgi:hypothetical protein